MLSQFNRKVRYFFGISRTEANGVIALTVMILLLVTGSILVPAFRGTEIDESDQAELDSLVVVLEKNLVRKEPTTEDINTTDSIELFQFDPNNASLEQFVRLGLSKEIGNRIIKYRNNGGVFETRKDLKKIYGLSEAQYSILSGYIHIEDRENKAKGRMNTEVPVAAGPITESALARKFDINEVDSSELQIIDGIGPTLSGRIIRFRSILGGFVNLDQLVEVYGLQDSIVNRLKEHSFISDHYEPRKIRINMLSADSLSLHPYIDPRKARVIVSYRDQHGKFENTSDLAEILVLDEEWIKRILPYIEF